MKINREKCKEIRCECHNLIARVIDDKKVEIKCRRCKRVLHLLLQH